MFRPNSLVVYLKLYTSFTQTILLLMNAGIKLWKLLSYLNLPMHTQIHICEQFLCQTYSGRQLAVGDMLHFSRALLF